MIHFFNDICKVFPDFENDIILEDRIKDIYQNYSVCEEGCTYIDIDIDFRTVTCECDVKTNISIEIPEIILENSDKNTNNLDAFKCFNLIFASDDKINNIGFWIFTFVLGGHVPLWFHYINAGIKVIYDYIIEEMKEYGYHKKDIKGKRKSTIKIQGSSKRKSMKLKSEKKDEKNNDNEQNKENDLNNKDNNPSSPPFKKNINNFNNNEQNENNKIGNSKRKRKTINNMIGIKNNILESNKNKGKKKKSFRKSLMNYNNNSEDNDEENNNEINSKKIRKKRKTLKIKDKTLNYSKNSKSNSGDLMKNSFKFNSPNVIVTQDFEFKIKNDKEEPNIKEGINLININLLEEKRNIIPKESNKILNNYTYEEAIEYDRRPFIKIFYIFLLSKQTIFHTFIDKSPMELISIKICIFIFVFSTSLTFNAFFYFNSHISEKYRYTKGLFFFTFSHNMTIILLACLITFVFTVLITKLSNSNYYIREIFKKEEDKLKSDKTYIVTQERKEEILKEIDIILNKLKKKYLALFLIEFIVILFYWYYATAFGHVYTNTQTSWILNSFISIIMSFIFDCFLCAVFSELYKISIDNKIKGLYKFVMFIYNFG